MTRTRTFSLFALLISLSFAQSAAASVTDGTIFTGGNAGYAWSNNIGWINFGATNGNVHVTNAGLTGFAWSSADGWIRMSPTNGGVTNSSAGVLGGFAWGQSTGWIDFSAVTIDAAGRFHGTATGPIIGILTFDCQNCDVSTDWRPTSVPPVVTPLSLGNGPIVGAPSFRIPQTSAPLGVIPGLPSAGARNVTTPADSPIVLDKSPANRAPIVALSPQLPDTSLPSHERGTFGGTIKTIPDRTYFQLLFAAVQAVIVAAATLLIFEHRKILLWLRYWFTRRIP